MQVKVSTFSYFRICSKIMSLAEVTLGFSYLSLGLLIGLHWNDFSNDIYSSSNSYSSPLLSSMYVSASFTTALGYFSSRFAPIDETYSIEGNSLLHKECWQLQMNSKGPVKWCASYVTTGKFNLFAHLTVTFWWNVVSKLSFYWRNQQIALFRMLTVISNLLKYWVT